MLLTVSNSQAIQSRVWQTQNQQLKELEEYQSKQLLTNRERAGLGKQ